MHNMLVVLAMLCAPAPPAGEQIYIAEESAVIAWDPATKTQHFIRRATFEGKATNFGFLVPTPTEPKLAAVNDNVFDTLQRKTSQQIEYRTRKEVAWTTLFGMYFLGSAKDANVAAGREPVEVLNSQKVAGYDAAVLDASDAKALLAWLEQHGYPASPDLLAWLDVYVQQRWKITAFKIDKSNPDMPAQTSAVKMSFATERPFFPYREPESQRNTSGTARVLRVFFVGPERVSATIGADGKWPADLRWSDALDDASRAQLASAIDVPLPAGTRLTRYDDTTAPRPGTDELFFARDADQARVVPPPYIQEDVVTTHVPVDVIALALLAIVFVSRRALRRR